MGNSADVQAVLSNFNIGVVQLDATGAVPRDGFGDPVFEVDTLGNPILVAVADSGASTLTLARTSTSTVELQSAALVDRLVHLLIDDQRAAVVAYGDVVIGDGTQASITRNDSVSVVLGIAVGLDFSIPSGGVSFTHNTNMDGLEFDPEDADQLVERLDTAAVITTAINRTPFGVAIDIAFVEGDLGDTVDVFTQANAVVLSTISLEAPAVDGEGIVTSPTTTTVTIQLTGEQARQLLGDRVTASVRSRLLPGTGPGGGRGALQAVDEIELDSQARVVLSSGGSQ